MASTGMRIVSIPDLQLRHLEKIKEFNLYKIIVYEGTAEEYYCFTTPEAALAIDTYLDYRKRCGERLTDDSRILGVIVGIWTAVVLVAVIDYNIRLSNVRANTSGLGLLIVERVAPSIEIGTLVALLFVIITIALIIRSSRSRVVAVAILSTVNLILTVWIISQIPKILDELFAIMSIGTIFNVAVMIFALTAYKKSVSTSSKSF